MGFTYGCDPEIFVVNADGKFVSAHGMIPGNKKEPFKVDCGAVQVDGMALEFNIDPVSTYEAWNKNIITVLRQLKGMLPKGHDFSVTPVAIFDKDVFDAAPEEAKELGCEPDYNAYTRQENNPPEPEEGSTMRTAAGHIHIGFTEDEDPKDEFHFGNCVDLVKQLDWFLGVPSVLKDSSPDSVKRRLLYGKAGAFRPKPYGVEYRTLSNFWLKNEGLRYWVFQNTIEAINAMQTKEIYKTLGSRFDVNEIINRPDGKIIAQQLKNEYPIRLRYE